MTTFSSCSGNAEAFIRRFLARVPPEVADTFSPAQLAAVQRTFGMRYTAEHSLDVRRSVRLPWGRYYFVLLFGRDRPGEGRSHRLAIVLVMALFAACVIAIAGSHL